MFAAYASPVTDDRDALESMIAADLRIAAYSACGSPKVLTIGVSP